MRTSLIPILSLVFILAPLGSWAASVSQVKGNKLMIQLDGLSVSQGAELYVLNPEGKKIGLVQVRQVKGDRALAEITKGRAVAGAPVQVKGAATSSASASASPSASPASGANHARGKKVVGLLAGLSMNTMSLTVQNGSGPKEDVTMKDTGYSLKGFYDYEMSPAFTVRLATGLETFTVKGNTATNKICENGGSMSCNVTFNYLAFEGSAHYNITQGAFKTWVGLGFSFLFAASKTNNVPNLSSDSSSNQMVLFGLGADWWTSKSAFIPFAVEYGMFPGSSNVKAESIFARAGYGFTF